MVKTDAVEHEIEELVVVNRDALLACVTDLYKTGYKTGVVKGAMAAVTGVALGVLISKGYNYVAQKNYQ